VGSGVLCAEVVGSGVGIGVGAGVGVSVGVAVGLAAQTPGIELTPGIAQIVEQA
jgi:hypothetical protein